MTFKPILNERLSDKVVDVIMERIRSGDLKPGDKLPSEPELADILGVSRGILREALTVLQARNYVIRKPKEGTLINPDINKILEESSGISLKEATYLDLLEMRECIEQREVEKIIDSATDQEIMELRQLVQAKENENNPGTVDYYFHYRLAELSRNAIFTNFIDKYYDVFDELVTRTMVKSERKEEIYHEHMQIVDAIEARDKKKAKTAIINHLTRVRQNIKGI
ncbi:FadR family transcriptional regulator [Clostridiales bacterium COT073_COT-073]|nr:FadR family transcriptional regulator [Clostridiales bacterium COT073_COT-073]